MKKYLLTSLIIISSGVLSAQSFSIGIRDGLAVTGIKGRFDFKNFESTQTGNRINHSLGVSVNLSLSGILFLQADILYDIKGIDFQNDEDLLGVAYRGFFHMDYITVPLTINIELGRNVKYYGYAGIYMGFLLDAKNTTTFSSTSSPEPAIYDMSYDPTGIFNKKELGGLTGLGLKIPLCEEVNMIIDLRYNFGLTKAAKNTDYDFDSNYWTYGTPDNFHNVYNRSFVFSIGFLYKFKKGSVKNP